jgi:hypothetical protein
MCLLTVPLRASLKIADGYPSAIPAFLVTEVAFRKVLAQLAKLVKSIAKISPRRSCAKYHVMRRA